MIEAEFMGNKVFISDENDAKEIFDMGSYGKFKNDKLILSLTETFYLMEKNKIDVKENNKKLDKEKFYKRASEIDPEFHYKYIVYSDLRERGLLVKTGFKFGTHFRVYGKGVKLKKGPKTTKEHTKWVVHAVPENYTCSFPELSRFVRLGQNIRAKPLIGVVDEEGDVTYYEIFRIKP